MTKRTTLPPEALAFYYALGPKRNYKLVADEYGVCERTVATVASHEGWQRKLSRFEEMARAHAVERVQETIKGMMERHLASMRVVHDKALAKLLEAEFDTAMEAARALALSIKHERLIRGEPTKRTELTVEETTRRQLEVWGVVVDSPGEPVVLPESDRSGVR